MINKRNYGQTYVTQTMPWGLYVPNGHRLLCSDGKIRAAKLAQTADTFFSVPASIRIGGKTISGYMTTEEACSADYKQTRAVYAFRAHTESNAKAGNPLPAWPNKFTPEHWQLCQCGELRS